MISKDKLTKDPVIEQYREQGDLRYLEAVEALAAREDVEVICWFMSLPGSDAVCTEYATKLKHKDTIIKYFIDSIGGIFWGEEIRILEAGTQNPGKFPDLESFIASLS